MINMSGWEAFPDVPGLLSIGSFHKKWRQNRALVTFLTSQILEISQGEQTKTLLTRCLGVPPALDTSGGLVFGRGVSEKEKFGRTNDRGASEMSWLRHEQPVAKGGKDPPSVGIRTPHWDPFEFRTNDLSDPVHKVWRKTELNLWRARKERRLWAIKQLWIYSRSLWCVRRSRCWRKTWNILFGTELIALYPKAAKRGQLLSKWGTVRRRVEEVLCCAVQEVVFFSRHAGCPLSRSTTNQQIEFVFIWWSSLDWVGGDNRAKSWARSACTWKFCTCSSSPEFMGWTSLLFGSPDRKAAISLGRTLNVPVMHECELLCIDRHHG